MSCLVGHVAERLESRRRRHPIAGSPPCIFTRHKRCAFYLHVSIISLTHTYYYTGIPFADKHRMRSTLGMTGITSRGGFRRGGCSAQLRRGRGGRVKKCITAIVSFLSLRRNVSRLPLSLSSAPFPCPVGGTVHCGEGGSRSHPRQHHHSGGIVPLRRYTN